MPPKRENRSKWPSIATPRAAQKPGFCCVKPRVLRYKGQTKNRAYARNLNRAPGLTQISQNAEIPSLPALRKKKDTRPAICRSAERTVEGQANFALHRALHDGRPGFPGAGGRLPIHSATAWARGDRTRDPYVVRKWCGNGAEMVRRMVREWCGNGAGDGAVMVR